MLASAAVGFAIIKCRENADRTVHAGHVIDDAGTDLHGAGAGLLPIHVAGHADQAAHRLENSVVPGARRVRSGLAESGDRAIDDAGIDGTNGVVVESLYRLRSPTLKFSIMMSDDFASSRMICCPSGLARSTVTDFLLRLAQR